jgi:hypothetical protein
LKLVILLSLLAMLCLGGSGLQQAYLLFRRKNQRFTSQFGITNEEVLDSLSKKFGWLFLAWGLWFLGSPLVILLLRVPFSSFVGFFVVGLGIQYIGTRVIKRTHGLKPAQKIGPAATVAADSGL